MRIIMSVDAESDGLYGIPFAIGAIVYNDGKEVARYFGRIPNSEVSDRWVIDNVLPQLGPEDGDEYFVTHTHLIGMLSHFSDWWNDWKVGAEVICHMGVPVESSLFRLMNQAGFMGIFDGPYPLHEVATALLMVGQDPTSVDQYAKSNGIFVQGNPHNPLYDAEVAAKVYMQLTTHLNQ